MSDDQGTYRTLRIKSAFESLGLPEDVNNRPLSNEELEAAINIARQSAPDVQMEIIRSLLINHSKLHERLQLAEIDSLTGLPKREVFEKVLNRVLISMKKHRGMEVALGILDIDNFKTFNDTYGHLAGDAVLRETAQRLRHHVRANDATARWGGEELVFLMINGETPGSTLLQPLKRVRDAMRKFTVEDKDRLETYKVGTSMGVVVIDHNNVKNIKLGEMDRFANKLFEKADKALYAVKTSGKENMKAVLLSPRPKPSNDPGPSGMDGPA